MGTPVTSEFPPQQVMGWNFGSHDGHGMIFFTVILIYEYSWWGVWGSLLERELLFFVFPFVRSEAGLNGGRVCRSVLVTVHPLVQTLCLVNLVCNRVSLSLC